MKEPYCKLQLDILFYLPEERLASTDPEDVMSEDHDNGYVDFWDANQDDNG